MNEKIMELNNLPLDEFIVEVKRLVKESPSCFEDVLLNAALEFFEGGTGIEYSFLLFSMAEEEIRRAVEKGANGEAVSELLEECVLTERRFYELLYKPESFSEKAIKWLPGECRYNDILVRFLAGGKKQLGLVLEAAKMRPDMAKALKCWIGA